MKDLSDGPFLDEFADPFVFGSETKLFSVHEFPVLSPAGREHFVRLLQRQAKRLFDNHVFAGFRRRDRMLGMQRVRSDDVHDVDVLVAAQVHVHAGGHERLRFVAVADEAHERDLGGGHANAFVALDGAPELRHL